MCYNVVRLRCLSQDETDTFRKGVREIQKKENSNDSGGLIVFWVALILWVFYYHSSSVGATTISPNQMRLIRAVRGAGY